MCFTFKKNNKRTKKPVNCFLQDGASVGMGSLQTSLPNAMEWTLVNENGILIYKNLSLGVDNQKEIEF